MDKGGWPLVVLCRIVLPMIAIIVPVGLFIHAGSRFEDSETFGCSQFIESMAFQATAHLSWLRTIKTIEALGIQAGCSAGRWVYPNDVFVSVFSVIVNRSSSSLFTATELVFIVLSTIV